MKSGRLFVAAAALAAILVSCSLGKVMNSASSGGSQTSPGSGNNGTLSVATDSARDQGVLVTPSGSRVDVTAAADDGTVVNCVDAESVAAVSDSSAGKGLTPTQAIIVGIRADGKPGAWYYSSGKMQPTVDEDSGKAMSTLPEVSDKNGAFRGAFGWVYHVMGISADGKIIIGYAENKKGFTLGSFEIDPGTTVGVYWAVSRHAFRPTYLVSRAHIIGTFDFSSLSGKKARRLSNLVKHSFAQLQFFLLDFLTSYLTMVDKNGVTFDSQHNVYDVTGTDQDGSPALATIDTKGNITISPVQSGQGSVQLTPASITITSATLAAGVQQGGTFPVSVNVQNLQSGSFSSAFTVDFYITASTTFTPATDFHAGSASISGIAGNGTASGSATLTVPSTITNQCAYVYAVVDAAGVTGTSTTNTTSTTTTAAVVLIYKSPAGGQTYNVTVETYLPSGSQTPNANTWAVLYKDNGNGSCSPVSGDLDTSTGNGIFGAFNAAGLSSGKYYILIVASANPGSFGINVRTSNVLQKTVQAALTEPSTSNDDTLGINGSNLTSYTGPSPTNGTVIDAGNALSWYIPSGDIDWFTFTLP